MSVKKRNVTVSPPLRGYPTSSMPQKLKDQLTLHINGLMPYVPIPMSPLSHDQSHTEPTNDLMWIGGPLSWVEACPIIAVPLNLSAG